MTQTLFNRTDETLAARLESLADGLSKSVEDRRRPMTQNATPKRCREYASRMHDAANLERGQLALRALADAIRQGTLPPALAGLKSKAAVLPLVAKALDCHSYYDVRPSDRYRDNSEKARAMQQLMETFGGVRASEREAAMTKESKLRQLRQRVAFGGIEGYFPTPAAVVEQMIREAAIEPGMVVLEPSAGSGHIAEAARDAGCRVICVEICYDLRQILELKGFDVSPHTDFTTAELEPKFDRVLMNPPFERGQDAVHVRRAFDLLKPGGRLVAVVSNGLLSREDRNSREFRSWAEDVAADVQPLDPEAFQKSERPTGVATSLVNATKPARA